jgi:hypothetical protein
LSEGLLAVVVKHAGAQQISERGVLLVTLRIRFRRIPPDAQQHIGRDVAGERRAWYFFHTPIQLTHGRQAPIIPSHATFMRQRYQDDSFQ